MRGQRANAILSLCSFLLALVIVEAGLRVYLATRVGTSVLWYGTAYNRHEIKGMRERERWQAKGDPRALRGAGDKHHTVRFHELDAGGYSKFFPNETKYTYDADTAEVIPVRINRHGFRGPDYSPSKPPGVIRVVTLGASSTFGYHDRDDETYPYFMERLLEQECGGGDDRFEVINLGIPHLTSHEIVELFRAEAMPLRPDVVTFYEGINDSAFDKPKVKSPIRKRIAAAYRAIREHVVTAAFIEEYVQSDVRKFSAADVARHRQGRSQTFLGSLSLLLEDCRSIGATLVVASQQARSLLVPRDALAGVGFQHEAEIVERKLEEQGFLTTKELNFLTHRELMRDLQGWANTNGVAFVDVIAALDRRRDVLVSWVHVNAEGNRMIAQAFVDAIRADICSDDRLVTAGEF